MKNTCCKNVSSENSHKSDLSGYYTYCGNNKKLIEDYFIFRAKCHLISVDVFLAYQSQTVGSTN